MVSLTLWILFISCLIPTYVTFDKQQTDMPCHQTSIFNRYASFKIIIFNQHEISNYSTFTNVTLSLKILEE